MTEKDVDYQEYRDELAAEIKKEPNGEKQREILQSAQETKEAMIRELKHGNVDSALKIMGSFNLSAEPEIIEQIDEKVSQEILPNSLIRFIPHLGDVTANEFFPLTLSKIREMIFSQLSSNLDLADYFIENLSEYYQESWVAESVLKAIEHYPVAEKFVHDAENGQVIWKNEPWVAIALTKAKNIVKNHEESITQGFSETDPYVNHPWLFDNKKARFAAVVLKMMTGQADAQEIRKLGVDPKEVTPVLAEINKKVELAYQYFLDQIRSNESIDNEDKAALINPAGGSVKMTPLLDNVRAFVARYLVQSIEGDITRFSEIGNLSGELDHILAEGFKRYIRVYEVDIPLYDKLYEEFDNLRETGRYPLEVFLGRDGIYAWIGRRTQDVARRRKLGLTGRKKLKETGEIIEIHPRYLVYPRYFRDQINEEAKRKFLEQERISFGADPLFYDTGYEGSIPEQIMTIMNFPPEEIDKRIRLLSAPFVHRRVRGIPENVRSEIVEYIEHNAKPEESAEGLIIDERTGKIRHIARPTNPEEQFYFMMVKQAIARHYWLREKLYYSPAGNINIDSRHFIIRIREEYAKLLPQEFVNNPKEFFAKHGELLKGSRGEGKYPDEEVILFKLTDGTEIVAKRVELRKTKEARKEFAILIAAKKAGLPTAEPVGFLSGKEETDGSYLLMKKIEGIPGRNFDKYLRKSGKFTEEQIKNILQQVTERNRQIAEVFRSTLNIDKRWRIKDTIIKFNEETGEVESVIPIDWERAQSYDPSSPKEID